MFVDRFVFIVCTWILVRSFPLRNESFITNDEEFIPSYEWKLVKEGQAIPAGLHVRMNLQTGEREAKLLDDPKVPQDPIGRLLDRLKKTEKTDERISILKQFEDLLHDYDNAVRFTNLNGLEYLQFLMKNEELLDWISLTLGAAFQGNDKVQLRAFHLDFGQTFIDLLDTQVNMTTKSKILFSLSTLLRNFPAAQKKFLDNRGMNTLVRLFDRSESQKKILHLLNDFLPEYLNKSIESVSIFSAWCSRLPNHLLSISADDFDQIEITLEVLIPLTDVCPMNLIDLLGRVDQLDDVYSLPENVRETVRKFHAHLHHRLSLISSSDL